MHCMASAHLLWFCFETCLPNQIVAGVDGELQDVDTLPDNMTDVVSLASDMSAYTDRSVKNSSMYSSSRQTASTIGGQGATKSKKKGRSGKIRQGTPEEEQKLCLLLSELAPSPELCTQVCACSASHVDTKVFPY